MERLLAPFAHEASARPLGLLRLAFGLLAWTRFANELLPLRSLEPDRLALSGAFFLGTTGMVLGLASRASTALAAVAVAYAVWGVGDAADFDHHHTKLMAFAIGLLALGETGRSVSLDRWLAGDRAPPERAPTWPLGLLGAFVCSVYAWTAYDKCEPAFLTGVRLEQIFVETWWQSQFAPSRATDAAFAAAAWATVAVELALPVALWVPSWRRWAVPLGLAMHAAFYLLLPVQTFTLEMMAIYLVFVDPDAVHDTMDRLLPPRRPVSGAPADP